MKLILNPSQAAAVYTAMVALNNVDGLLDAKLTDTRTQVTENIDGSIFVVQSDMHLREVYMSQDAFARAYGLE